MQWSALGEWNAQLLWELSGGVPNSALGTLIKDGFLESVKLEPRLEDD